MAGKSSCWWFVAAKMEKCPSNVQAQGGRVLFKTLEGFQSLSCISSEWTHSPTGSSKMAYFGL